jgi:pilus assembly protein Flp/PilA
VSGGAVPSEWGVGSPLAEPPEGVSMLRFFVLAQNFLAESLRRDDRGATAVEYGLMVALIAAVIVGVVTVLGTTLQGVFQTVVNAI